MFADDLLIIDRLRNEAINVQEPHVSGISRLVTYAAQLKWLGGKFPVDVSVLEQDMYVYGMLTEGDRWGWNFHGILHLDSIRQDLVGDYSGIPRTSKH
jgi:hypothetical protein